MLASSETRSANLYAPNLILYLLCVNFLFSILSNSVSGYKIDQSCAQKGIENDVRNAMTSAFEMVDAALDNLSATPVHADTVELIGFLFAKEGVNPRQLLESGQMKKTSQILRALKSRYRPEVTGEAAVGISHLASCHDWFYHFRLLLSRAQIIFCHYDRFKLIDSKKKLYRDESMLSI